MSRGGLPAERVKSGERSGEKRSGESGSALLIVFLFAAVAAIMLYMEMPVVVFEARRQKEQLLIDRGNEYKHAVKLYVRKIGTYPPSLDALESTNQMRFLRHKFTDPFTGEANWRLLHAGPNGIIIDSKVNPIATPGQNGATANSGSTPGPGSTTGNTSSAFGSTGNNASSGFGSTGNNSNSAFGSTSSGPSSAFGSSSSSGFGSTSSSSFGSNSSSSFGSSSNTAAVIVPDLPPPRPPAISANGASSGAGRAEGSDQNGLPVLALPGDAGQDAASMSGSQGMQQGAADGGAAAAGQSGVPQSGPGEAGPDAMQTARNLLSNPNPTPNGGQPGGAVTSAPAMGTGNTSAPMGAITSGGIAGVASIARGHSIKTVHDQTNYSLWEFYYDPTKDNATPGIAGAVPAGSTANNGAFGQNTTNQNFFNQSQPGQNPAGGAPAFPAPQTSVEPPTAPPTQQ